MTDISILKSMKKIAVFILILTSSALLFAAETDSLWQRPPVKGCWVSYILRFPPDKGVKNPITVKIQVHAINTNGSMDLDFVINGIKTENGSSARIQVSSNKFDVAEAFGLSDKMPVLTAIEKDTIYKLPAMKAEVKARLTSWPNLNIKTEVVRSNDIPFGLASLIYGGFIIEVERFSWGD